MHSRCCGCSSWWHCWHCWHCWHWPTIIHRIVAMPTNTTPQNMAATIPAVACDEVIAEMKQKWFQHFLGAKRLAPVALANVPYNLRRSIGWPLCDYIEQIRTLLTVMFKGLLFMRHLILYQTHPSIPNPAYGPVYIVRLADKWRATLWIYCPINKPLFIIIIIIINENNWKYINKQVMHGMITVVRIL